MNGGYFMEVSAAAIAETALKTVKFPAGLVGLEEYRHFVLKELPEYPCFWMLKSMEEELFGLVLTNPFLFVPDYEFELPAAFLSQMGEKRQMEIFVTVTLAQKPQDITANLMGPIVIDRQQGIGFQVVLPDRNYSARYPLMSGLKAGG
jgi:flagellar assembly factor FliW